MIDVLLSAFCVFAHNRLHARAEPKWSYRASRLLYLSRKSVIAVDP